jgi:hypothetical protein
VGAKIGAEMMDADKISDDDLLQVIRHFLNQFEAGESNRFDLEQASVIIKELTISANRLSAH